MPTAQTRIGTLLIIGLGLIGGSLAAALRRTDFAGRITAFNRNRDSLDHALSIGIIDAAPLHLDDAIAEADLIVIGVPTLAVAGILEHVRDHARPGTVITDVASVKGSVILDAINVFGSVPAEFVPAHPIAGSERSGVAAADASLFVRHRVILTPLPDTAAAALRLIEDMWRLTGAQLVRMGVEEHDRVLAMTSHLPHALAFTLVDALARQPSSEDIFRLAAGGFRDFTRIASSDVVMWRDISLANRDALLGALDLFADGLAQLRCAVAAGDADGIAAIFSRARTARGRYLEWLESDGAPGNRHHE